MTEQLPPAHRSNSTTFHQDVQAEGEPEVEFNPGIARRLPRKTVASGAVIRNDAGQVLFVIPNYKDRLEIPGGVSKLNESPEATCHREIVEELGFELEIGRMLVVDWVPAHGAWSDSLQFIYDGGILDAHQIEKIQIADDELVGWRFLNLDEAKPQLRPALARRVERALEQLEADSGTYSEFGRGRRRTAAAPPSNARE